MSLLSILRMVVRSRPVGSLDHILWSLLAPPFDMATSNLCQCRYQIPTTAVGPHLSVFNTHGTGLIWLYDLPIDPSM